MDIKEAKELVIKAGKRLVESGLIARTWGNVSCRVDESTFVITPSGRDYKNLTSDEIVEVNIEDLSYKGNIKPSSEKRIHKEVYKLHQNINFVIHTHQEYASIIGSCDLDYIEVNNIHPCVNGIIICAKYALPGTKSLSKNVALALEESNKNTVIMKNHGAVCFGENYEEAFNVASYLEKACENLIKNKYLELSRKDKFEFTEMCLFSLNQEKKICNINIKEKKKLFNGKREGNKFIINNEQKEFKLHLKDLEKNLFYEAKIYHYLFNKYQDINNIIFDDSPEILAICNTDTYLKPLLDDFVQLCGSNIRTVEYEFDLIVNALKKAPVVFIENVGALFLGKDLEEAEAVRLVTKKACKSLIGASLFGNIKPINKVECKLMRFLYLNQYSKKA